jgi:hypothetical protein
MNHFCREASRLESDALERRLTLAERLRLRLHLLVCDACRNYRAELRLMRQLFRRIQKAPEGIGRGMSEAERAEILAALKRVGGE